MNFIQEQSGFISKIKDELGLNGMDVKALYFTHNGFGQGFRDNYGMMCFLPPDKQIVVYETKSGKDLPPDEKADLEVRCRKLLGDRFGGLMSREEYEQTYKQ